MNHAPARPLTVFQGLPGSGKSKRLIETVNAARAAGRVVATFACGESPWLRAWENFSQQRLIGCREPGIICPLDHFVSTDEAVEILAAMPAGALAAFEEAHYFSAEIAGAWLAAAQRGVEVLLCMASWPQRERMVSHPATEINFTAPCEVCRWTEAVDFVIVPGTDSTQLVCADCLQKNLAGLRGEIARRLQAMNPSPGENFLEQPVALEACADWLVREADAPMRGEIMRRLIEEAGLLKEITHGEMSFLDAGCHTGFFCRALQPLGFRCEGVDVDAEEIAVARLLDSALRRSRSFYVAQDVGDYLCAATRRKFDVTSATAGGFLEALFARTRRICFVTAGDFDSAPVGKVLRQRGGFDAVRHFPAGTAHGLADDLFAGLKRADLADFFQAIRQCVPRGGSVLVVSKGDGWLLAAEGFCARHFPQDAGGGYAGYHPHDSAEARAMLEAQRQPGDEWLAFPPSCLWWLEHYGEFQKYLDEHHRRLETGNQSVIYHLSAKLERSLN